MSLTKVSYSMITGAVANILDFGADATGVADSTTAIQAAIDFVNTKPKGGAVYIPSGTYKITSSLQIPYGVSIFGEGGTSSIIECYDCDGLTFTSFGYAFGNMFYQDFGLTAASGTNRIAIYMPPDASTGDGLHFYRLRLFDWNIGITLQSTWATNINECMIGPVRTGISLGSGAGAQTVKIQLRDNQLGYGASAKGNADKVGIQIGSTNEFNEAIHISGNSIFGFDKCIVSSTATYLTILDNDLNCVVDGISFNTANGGYYIANNFLETYGRAIVAGPTSVSDLGRFCVIQNNTFVGLNDTPGTATIGVQIGDSDSTSHGGSVTVQNNTFGGFSTNDIRGFQIANVKLLNNYCGSSAPANNISISTAQQIDGSVNIIADNFCLKALQVDLTAYAAGYVILQNNAENGVFRAWQQAALPTTGTWRVGDIVWNNAPASGQPPGWMCTVAGTPGTWVAMANLA
jgi:hypothetical protein